MSATFCMMKQAFPILCREWKRRWMARLLSGVRAPGKARTLPLWSHGWDIRVTT